MDTVINFLVPEIMLSVPWYLWPPVGLILLFVFFCFVVWLKVTLIRNFGRDNKIARAVFYIFGGRFLYLDALANYVCWSPIALHWPGRLGEDRTITAHANALIKKHVYVYGEDKKIGILFGSWRIRWAVKFALFTCRHLNNIEPGHCKAMK